MRVAFYLRVSTTDQNTDNQKRELEAVAAQRGWTVVRIYADKMSGAKKRPDFDEMMADAVRGKFDLVAAWSVDRLSRSLIDLINCMNQLQATKVQLYLHQQALDTTTPAGRLMFQVSGAFAEYERAILRERVRTGLARARAQGRIGGRRRKASDVLAARARQLRVDGKSYRQISKLTGIPVSTLQGILKVVKPIGDWME